MKPLSKNEIAIQNDGAIEARRIAPPIASREPKLKLKSLDSRSIPTGASRFNTNVPREQSDYPRLEALTVWVLIAVLVVLSCGALYVLWSKASGGW